LVGALMYVRFNRRYPLRGETDAVDRVEGDDR
jgi:hypothetical protein